jgi:O-antigen ligase
MVSDAPGGQHSALRTRRWLKVVVVVAVLALAVYLGGQPSVRWLALLAAGFGALVLLSRPVLGVPAIVVAALALPLEFGTGTEVKLNPVTLLVPVAAGLWLLMMFRRRDVRLPHSRTNLPLLLFLAAGLLSLGIGMVIWDPQVPRPENFTLVQLAQWGIYGLSALAFWLTASLIEDETWLWRLTAGFLALGGALAVTRVAPGIPSMAGRFATLAVGRAPFWVLLAALAGGQLLYNRRLPKAWYIILLATLGTVVIYAFVRQRATASNWVGVAAAASTLVWLRFPRLRLPLALLVAVLAVAGLLIPAIFDFAGGAREWNLSGESRLALIDRVLDVTMRNPITGLGPAAYRPYTRITPLQFGHAYYLDPRVNSHNNYVDLFTQTGILGLALFAWFATEVAILGLRLRRRYQAGFAAGYVNGMLGAAVGALVIMMVGDWILPSLYNIGFPGFQASVLFWLFLGGLVALDRMGDRETRRQGGGETGGAEAEGATG